MDQNQSIRTAVDVALAGLLCGPVLAIAAFIQMRRQYSYLLSPVAIGSAIVLLLAIGLALTGFSFTSIVANYSCFAILFAAYAFLAVSCFRIKSLVVRILVLIASAAPILAGMPILLIILMDSRVEHAEQLAPNVICRITGWGMAGSGSGYRVSLYRSWDGISFLERKVLDASVVQAGYSGAAPPDDVSCADLFAQYQKFRASAIR